MIPNRRRQPYVESHRILELRTAATLVPDLHGENEAALRPFDMRQHFVRGGFEASLYAANDAVSADWLDRHLREDMPLLPPEFQPQVFWATLAKRNGDPATSIQRALKRKIAVWQIALDAAQRDGLLFELPFWPDAAHGRAPLIYFGDTGVWHRAFAPLRDPNEVRNVRYDAKAWEGFNVNAFRRLTLPRADCYVWRRDGAQAGEIDLVIAWRSGERWAVEISSDPNKRATPAFYRGVEVVGAVRKLIVRPGASRDDLRQGCEYCDLEEALRNVAEVCALNAQPMPGPPATTRDEPSTYDAGRLRTQHQS